MEGANHKLSLEPVISDSFSEELSCQLKHIGLEQCGYSLQFLFFKRTFALHRAARQTHNPCGTLKATQVAEGASLQHLCVQWPFINLFPDQ